jgi:hypothetical protein
VQSTREIDELIELFRGVTSYHFGGNKLCECGNTVMVMLTISGGKDG